MFWFADDRRQMTQGLRPCCRNHHTFCLWRLTTIPNRRLPANLFLLFITLVWGATFTLTKDALYAVPVYPFLFVRFLFAGATLVGISVATRTRRRTWNRRVWLVGSGLGLVLFGGYALQTLGLLTVSAPVTGFLTGLNVVLVPILAIPLLRTVPRVRTWLGALLAAVGLVLISGGGLTHLQFGDTLVLLCAVCLALQIVLTEKYAMNTDALTLAAVELLVVALCSLFASLSTVQGSDVWSLSIWLRPSVLWAVLVNALLGTALAYWGQNMCQKFTSAGEIAIIFTMEPVFAAVISWVFAGVALAGAGIAGGAMIFTSMLVADPSIRMPLHTRLGQRGHKRLDK